MCYKEKFGRFHLSCHKAQVSYLLRYPKGWSRLARTNIICKLEYNPWYSEFIPMLYIGTEWEPEHNIWGKEVKFSQPGIASHHCLYVNTNGLPK